MMKSVRAAVLSGVLASACVLSAAGTVMPSRTRWFEDARFGLFIHWGLYSIPAKGEWAFARFNWKPGEFESLTNRFTGVNYNPRQWARLAKGAGMRYAVLTTRHHDGFCLFDSRFTGYKSTASAYGRDAVREFVEAFRAEGLRVGFYHSLPDWTHPGYADPESPEGILHGKVHVPAPEQHAAFKKLLHSHIRQLMSDYGKIDLLFLDYTSRHKAGVDYFDREAILKIVYECQPDILVNDRLTYEKNISRMFDYYTPEVCVPPRPQVVNGRRVAWETCATMNDHWGYFKGDENWKPLEAIVAGLVGCVSRGGNLLLNIGPDGTGALPPASIERLKSLGEWFAVNGESIYGCGGCDLTPPFGCAYTGKGNVIYCHYLQPPIGDTILPGLFGRVKSAVCLRTGEEVPLTNEWGRELLVATDQRLRTRGLKAADVLKIELK